MKIKFLIVSIICQAALCAIPGLINLDNESSIANDLVYKDKILSPNDALELLAKSNNQFDLSSLNPAPSDIWKDTLGTQLNIEKDIKIQYFDNTQFVNTIPSTSGNFRFKVINLEQDALGEELVILSSKEVHNVLMLAALLQKIGYQTPGIKYLKKVNIEFSSKEQKEAFKNDLNESTLGDPNRWLEDNDQSDTLVIMQDIVAMSPNSRIYNFALANDLGDVHFERRAMKALAVAFSLTNIPESINLLKYSAAKVKSNHVILDLVKSISFTPSLSDAKWITKRILKLERSDWKEIVAASKMPETVQAITLEKMLARRNSLAQAFGLDAKEFEIKTGVTNGLGLVDGKLVLEFFPGYARRFSYGDPENPLSSSELTKFIASKGITTVIDSAISTLNSVKGFSTDIEGMNKIEFDKIVAKATEDAIEQGLSSVDIPVSTWFYPTYSAGLILSRNVVAGNFLGTDNRIQLVDSFGVRMNAGAYLGVTGLSPAGASARAGVSFSRTYSHIKPLYSVGQALKYPYKNVIVPLFKRGLVSELKKLKGEESEVNVDEFLTTFKEDMEVGDSIIITDSYGADAGLTGYVNVASDIIRVGASLLPGKNIISRTHIYRASEDKIQVYKDYGNINKIALAINLSADKKVPILKSITEFAKGKARTKYYNFDISNLESGKETLMALRKLFTSNSVEGIEHNNPPFKLNHKFDQMNSRNGLFTFKFNKVKSNNEITIETPDGSKRELYRRYDGSTVGNDYQSYLFDLLASLVTSSSDVNLSSSAGQSGNPGFSFYGKARNTVASFEAIKDSDGKYKSPFIKVEKIWNGWQITKKKAKDIIKRLERKYNFRLFSEQALAATKKIFLYNINANLIVYEEGIENLLTHSRRDIEKILESHSSIARTSGRLNSIESYTRRLYNYIRNAKKYKDSDIKKYSKYALKASKLIEDKLDMNGFIALFGSQKNFYFYANIDGFRVGDEGATNINDIQSGLESHTIGEIGREGMLGPLERTRQKLKMTRGEFLIAWILRRVI